MAVTRSTKMQTGCNATLPSGYNKAYGHARSEQGGTGDEAVAFYCMLTVRAPGISILGISGMPGIPLPWTETGADGKKSASMKSVIAHMLACVQMLPAHFQG
jgi:hypothetical protein